MAKNDKVVTSRVGGLVIIMTRAVPSDTIVLLPDRRQNEKMDDWLKRAGMITGIKVEDGQDD